MALLLGAIADDFTGATDLCSMLVRNGMRTVQLIGVPQPGREPPEADAVVVALKSRTAPVAEAVSQSLASLDWLRAAGARQYFFKYCSTFDSTDEGNIGPVADALLDALGQGFTVACPAFPETGRTIYRGHLFVGDALLSDTHMRDHPLTPMRDANLVRVLGRQTRHRVGLVPYEVVRAGAGAIKARFAALRADGVRHAVVDVLEDSHLLRIGEACAELALVTGGSGVAMGLPANFRRRGELPERREAAALPRIAGPGAVLAGSCSVATLGQIAEFAREHPAFRLEPRAIASDEASAIASALHWLEAQPAGAAVLLYASAPAEELKAVQAELGRERAGALVEGVMGKLATALVERGIRRLVVAGGETSGAVVQALGIDALAIGAPIDPGVPCTVTVGREPPLALALKSGNFGAPDFFAKALRMMP
jgi:uncharacterized protein YgbK (DUF1537 family)